MDEKPSIKDLAQVAGKRDENLRMERRPQEKGFMTKAWFK